jgi:hypothetical protein
MDAYAEGGALMLWLHDTALSLRANIADGKQQTA